MGKDLIILDLNGTLIKRSKKTKFVQTRPYMPEFLRHVFDNFAVMVWSSARPESVQAAVTSAFESYLPDLVACWDRRAFGLGTAYYGNPVTVKDLRLVWRAMPLWNERNTILLDDSPDKIRQAENWIEVSTWKVGEVGDDVLLRLVRLLERWRQFKIYESSDVRQFIKETNEW
jgi:hypothetical protein